MKIIQRDYGGGSTWQDILNFDSPYATSVVIHELVEIRRLQAEGIQPLKLATDDLEAALVQHIEAHVAAIYEEHLFLPEYIRRVHQTDFELATLIKANRGDDNDLALFLESNLGVYFLEIDRLAEAAAMLDTLKGEAK